MLLLPMLSTLPVLSGCKVVDAPENLEALMVFGFVHFADEDDKALEATADQLLKLIEPKKEALAEGYRVNDLTTSDLAEAGIDASNEGGIVGAMGLVDYRHLVDPVVEAVSRPDKDVMFPDKFLEYDVLDTTDRPCFLSAECPRLDQNVYEKTKVAVLGEAERTYDSDYRWVSTDTIPQAAFIRQVAPKEMKFSSGFMIVHQQYSFVMIYQDHQIARRIEAFWVDAEFIGMDVPENTAVNTAVSGMSDQAARIDDWIDENL